MPGDHPEYLPLYRALVEYARDLLGVLDLDGRFRYLSPAARTIFNRAPGKLVNDSLIDWTHPEDRDIARNWVRRLSGRAGDGDACTLRLGVPGRWRVLDFAGVSIMEDPTTQRIAFSGSDVTERVKAAESLRESEQRFRSAFDDAPIGKALIKPNGELVEVNRVLAEMLGCWVSELIGRRFEDFLHAEDAPEFTAGREALREDETAVVERELRLVQADGPQRWGWLNLSALGRGEGGTNHLILQIQDVTDRHEAEARLKASNEDLRKSNEELKRFAFIASHDLREPLRGIKGSIQLLVRRNKDTLTESGHEMAQQAMDGVTRLQDLTGQLVEYAEQMRGADLAREPVAIQSVVQSVLDDLSDQVAQSKAFLDVGNLPTVLGDPEQIHQIFLHLIDNAIKFRHAERPLRIQIKAEWGKGMWRFEIADNGIGIDPEHHEQIFEVFRRLHPDGSYPGTGMGLATTRKIIEHHGGSIRVESQIDSGARFIFQLPPE